MITRLTDTTTLPLRNTLLLRGTIVDDECVPTVVMHSTSPHGLAALSAPLREMRALTGRTLDARCLRCVHPVATRLDIPVYLSCLARVLQD